MTKRPKSDKLLDAMERAVLKILANPKATTKDRIDAIAHGSKLAAIKHKITGPDDDGEYFGGE